MGVVIGKSLAITNRDAFPRVKNDASFDSGMLKELVGYCTIASGDSIGSTYIIGSIPSNCRVSDVSVACPATPGAIANIGVQDTTANGGGPVDGVNGVQCFASAQALTSALTPTNITNESGLVGISDLASAEQSLWQALGYTTDPCRMFDVVLTLTAAATGAGGAFVRVRFVV